MREHAAELELSPWSRNAPVGIARGGVARYRSEMDQLPELVRRPGAWLSMRLCLRGQRLVQYREVRAMFPNNFPDQLYAALRKAKSVPGMSRKDLLRVLRSIAAVNRCGASFAAAVDPAELAGLEPHYVMDRSGPLHGNS